MTIKNKKFSITLGVLAFAAVIYFVLPLIRGSKVASSSEGLHRFSVETFQENKNWAYRIYQDTTLVIEQRSVPGIAGNNGFKNDTQALKTGELVRSKLEKGIFPPTISKHELDSLGIRY